MRVLVETTNGLERKVTVALPADSLQKLLDEEVRNTASKVKLPGFRAGKVPLKVVRKRYGEKLLQDAAASLLQTSLQDAVAKEQLSPAGSMNVDIVTLAAGKDFEYTATFEVFPEFDLAPFDTLRLRIPKAEIAEADIDNTVEQLRRQQMQWHPVERPAQAQDRVLVDYSLEADGETLESRDGMSIVVTEADEGLDKAIAGMAVTETRTFPVTLRVRPRDAAADDAADPPDDPGADETPEPAPPAHQAAAQTPPADAETPADADDQVETRNAIGKVTLRGVDEPHLPELDDAFFDSFGVAQEDDRMVAFRRAVRDRMEVELDTAVRRASEREVLDALATAHDFDLPNVLVQGEIAASKERFTASFGSFPPSFEETLRTTAEETVRSRLVVRAIAERESITADDDRVDARIAEIASGYEQPADVRRFLRSTEEQLERIEAQVLQEHVVEKVLADANVATVEMPYAAVVANQKLPDEPPAETPDEAATDEADSTEPADAAETAAATSGEDDGAPDVKPKLSDRLLRRLFGRASDA